MNTVESGGANGKKALWAVQVLVLPLLGLIVWFSPGPRGKS